MRIPKNIDEINNIEVITNNKFELLIALLVIKPLIVLGSIVLLILSFAWIASGFGLFIAIGLIEQGYSNYGYSIFAMDLLIIAILIITSKYDNRKGY